MKIPQYKHDCNKCTFLGRDIDDKNTPVDMYFCHQYGLPTIIIRYGDKGEDYLSVPISLIINFNHTYNNMNQFKLLLKYTSISENKNLWLKDKL